MTLTNPALFLPGQTHSAGSFRRWNKAMLADGASLVTAEAFAVAPNGTPNMTVDVAAGQGYIQGSEAAPTQGVYFCESAGSVSLAIAAADGSNARKDLIVLRVQDSDYAGSVDEVTLEVVTGTPASTPVEPAPPENSLVLATINVAASETAIEAEHIVDRRRSGAYAGNTGNLSAALGATIVCTLATRPSSPRAGQMVYQTDTDTLLTYYSGTWKRVLEDSDLVRDGAAAQRDTPLGLSAGAATLVTFPDEEEDSGSMFTPGGSTITVPTDGVYTVSAQFDSFQGVYQASIVTGAKAYIFFQILEVEARASSTSSGAAGSITLRLSAGDTAALRVNSVFVSTSSGVQNARLSVYKVSE